MKQNNTHIIFVIGSLALGGAEQQMTLLSKELIKREYVVHIFTLDSAGPLRKELLDAGAIIYSQGYNSATTKIGKLFLLTKATIQLAILSWKVKPQALHAFLPLTNLIGAIAGRLGGVNKIITSKRALATHQDRHPGWKYFDRIANTLSTKITANSQAVKTDTILRDKVPSRKIEIIYNGLPLPDWNHYESQREVTRSNLGLRAQNIGIIFVANLIPYKGHQDLIKGFALACKTYNNLDLFLVGEDRGIKSNLQLLSNEEGLKNKVHFLGLRKDIPMLIAAMDIGVMASHEEGFSNALLEKLSAGLPVVATNVGGNAEAIDEMPNCYLVATKSPQELSLAITHLIGNIEEAKKNKDFRRNSVSQRYAVASMVDAYEKLYHGI